MRKSTLVVCNSKFVQKAVCEHFDINIEHTDVGPCGVDLRIPELASVADVDIIKSEFGGNGFLLAFATGDERENFRLLPKLWEMALKAGYPGKLVIAGINDNALYAQEIKDDITALGLTETVSWVPFLGEAELPRLAGLYAAADFYLETSLHEGFGMQLVEAMACGTTCFSSGKGALADVGGGFPLDLPDKPKVTGDLIAAEWRRGSHNRDNQEQVAFAKSYSWDIAGEIVANFVMQSLKH